MPRVRVVGFGSFEAGDDAAGLLAVRVARERTAEAGDLPGVEFVEAGAGIDASGYLDGVDAVILVDAVRVRADEGRPGRLIHFEIGPDGFPAELRTSVSSHGLGLAEGVAIARALGRRPRLVFLGLQAWHEQAGEALSVPVAAALATLAGEIRLEARRLLEEPSSDSVGETAADTSLPGGDPPPHPPNLIVGAAPGHIRRAG
jgi:hydrogenase maturation protease